jgi:DNA-binding Xre family transcriptional regulator
MRIDRERVRQLMLRQGFQTFTELADHLGISKQAMSAWFGGGAFSSGNLEQLCRALKCTPNDILVMDAPNSLAPAAKRELAFS